MDGATACALSVKDDRTRGDALETLLQAAMPLPLDQMLSVVQSVLARAATVTRRSLLADVAALAPAFATLGGEATVQQVAHNVEAVGRWWP